MKFRVLEVAPKVSQSFPLKSDRFIWKPSSNAGTTYHGKRILRKFSSQSIRGTNQLVSPVEKASSEKGHFPRSVQSTAQSLLASPFIVGRDKSRYFFWIGAEYLEE